MFESNVTSPVKLSIVFPLIFIFPVSTLEPFITVMSAPVVNVTPWSMSMFSVDVVKSTCPVS